MPPVARKPSPRKRTPTTNPELAVRRAEAGRPSPRKRPVAVPPAPVPTEPMPAVAAPAVRVRSDDPPIYVDVWNGLYALENGQHPAT